MSILYFLTESGTLFEFLHFPQLLTRERALRTNVVLRLYYCQGINAISVELGRAGPDSTGEICGLAGARVASKCWRESGSECVPPDSVLTTGLSAQELKSQERQDGRGECRKMSCEKQPWGAVFCVGGGRPPRGHTGHQRNALVLV